nr:DUF2059 domain-containing protein [Allomuricauda sp.]
MNQSTFRKVLALGAFVLFSFSIQAQESSSSYEDTLATLFEKNGSHETFIVVVDQLFEMYKKSYTSVDVETWNDLQNEFKNTSISELVELLTPIYQKYMSEDDLKALIDFYDSPVGQKFAKYTPEISKESMAVGQEWGLQIGNKVLKRLEEKGF